MKKIFTLIAVSAVLFASCAKEPVVENNKNKDPQLTGKTITFSASIDINGVTKAELDGLNIKWTSSDKIGVISDQGGDIQICDVTPGDPATTCTFTANAVAGATTYYFLYTGHDDFSEISFDASTATFSGYKYVKKNTTLSVDESFSGLGIGCQQVGENEVSSDNYYGAALSMAGKATVTPGSAEVSGLSMIPCLALVKVKIASTSVSSQYATIENTTPDPYNKVHSHDYSGVRGLRFRQKGFNRSSGAYSVNLAGTDMVVSPVTSTVSLVDGQTDYYSSTNQDTDYREKASSSLLKSDKTYYMCVIPGGSISGFTVSFLGYKSATSGDYDYNEIYPMTLNKSLTVKPGDFIDLGTLDPVTLQMTKNAASDLAADEAEASAPPYVPAIDIDGDLSDWDSIDMYPDDATKESFGASSTDRIREWKFKSDSKYVYFLIRFRKNRSYYYTSGGNPSANLYLGFDTDNNSSTGSSAGNLGGCDAYAHTYPFTNASGAAVAPVDGYDANSVVHGSGISETNGVVYMCAYDEEPTLNDDTANIWVELSIPRDKLNLPAAGQSISVGCSYQWSYTAKESIKLE